MSFLKKYGTGRRAVDALITLADHPDALYDDFSFEPNIVVVNGKVGAIVTSRPADKEGDGYSVSRAALEKLRDDWEARVIDDFLIVFTEDGEYVVALISGLEQASHILREEPLYGKNGRGPYYWLNARGEVVPAQRQRKRLKPSVDMLD